MQVGDQELLGGEVRKRLDKVLDNLLYLQDGRRGGGGGKLGGGRFDAKEGGRWWSAGKDVGDQGLDACSQDSLRRDLLRAFQVSVATLGHGEYIAADGVGRIVVGVGKGVLTV